MEALIAATSRLLSTTDAGAIDLLIMWRCLPGQAGAVSVSIACFWAVEPASENDPDFPIAEVKVEYTSPRQRITARGHQSKHSGALLKHGTLGLVGGSTRSFRTLYAKGQKPMVVVALRLSLN